MPPDTSTFCRLHHLLLITALPSLLYKHHFHPWSTSIFQPSSRIEMEKKRNTTFPPLMWLLIAVFLFQNLLVLAVSSGLEDEKNIYIPDPFAAIPPPHTVTPNLTSPPPTPSPIAGTPRPRGHRTPSFRTPPRTNCRIPPAPPTDPSHGGGRSYNTTPPRDPSRGSGGTNNPTPSPPSDPSHGSGGTNNPKPPPPPRSSGRGHFHPTRPPSGGRGHYHPTPPPPPRSGGGSHDCPPTTGGSPPSISSPPTIPSIDPGAPSTPGGSVHAPPLIPDPSSNPFTGTCDYWRTHPAAIRDLLGWWGTLGSAFGRRSFPGIGSSTSLLQALSNTRADGLGELYREGTASLLNSMANYRFPYSTRHVRESFAAALGSNEAAAAQAQRFKMANEGRLGPRD